MAVLVAPFRGPTKSCFEGEAIYQIKLTPHNYTRSWFPCFLNWEIAIWKAKIFRVPCEQKWENALF
jgi:hypothetical protein